MFITNGYNEEKINLIKVVGSELVNKTLRHTNINDKYLINKNNIMNSIIGNLYETMLMEKLRTDKNIKGNIVFKPHSWLNLIDAKSLTQELADVMVERNITLLDKQDASKFADRLTKEILLYKDKFIPILKNTVEKVNEYKDNSKVTDKTIMEHFNLVYVDPYSVRNTLEEKEWLALPLISNQIKENINKSKTLASIINIDKYVSEDTVTIATDPEINILINEDIKNDIYKTDTLDKLHSLLNNNYDMLSSILSIEFFIPYINTIILAITILKDYLNTTKEQDSDFSTVYAILSILKQKYLSFVNMINTFDRNDTIIIGYKITQLTNDDKDIYVYVYNKNYRNTIQDVKDLDKFILGKIVHNVFMSDKKHHNNTFYTNIVRKPSLIGDKSNLSNYLDYYVKSKSIELNNKVTTTIKNYIKFAIYENKEDINDYTTFDMDKIEKQINKINTSDILNIEHTILSIYNYSIFNNTNFPIFTSCIEEAEKVYKQDCTNETILAYAIVKFTLLYLISQTDLV